MESIHKDVQEILETDLSCAICQDIYINPLILNCSHSFCKFCVYRWLSKKTGCPQCRMTVAFQAENLALRNIINRMVQKSSQQFQNNRTICVNQRLKDEEELEKEGTTRILPKENASMQPQAAARVRVYASRVPTHLRSTFPGLSVVNVSAGAVDRDFMTSSDSSGSTSVSYPPRFLFPDGEELSDEWGASSDDSENVEAGSRDFAGEDQDDDDDEDEDDLEDAGDDGDNELDETFEIDSDMNSSSEDEEMDDGSFGELDVTGNTDSSDDDSDDDDGMVADSSDEASTSGDEVEDSSDEDDTDWDDVGWLRSSRDSPNARQALPNTESENETASDDDDDSTEWEDDSMGSDDTERYSNESTIEYGTSDESG